MGNISSNPKIISKNLSILPQYSVRVVHLGWDRKGCTEIGEICHGIDNNPEFSNSFRRNTAIFDDNGGTPFVQFFHNNENTERFHLYYTGIYNGYPIYEYGSDKIGITVRIKKRMICYCYNNNKNYLWFHNHTLREK